MMRGGVLKGYLAYGSDRETGVWASVSAAWTPGGDGLMANLHTGVPQLEVHLICLQDCIFFFF